MASGIAMKGGENSVVLIERNEKPGKKLYITGKGRCNVTNRVSKGEFMRNIISNPKFMYSSLTNFDCEDTIRLIESAGIPLKVERGNRVFPVSDKASDIIKALKKKSISAGVRFKTNEKLLDLKSENKKITALITDKARYSDIDAVILATGGVSYPSTGSDGSGLKIAEKCGHAIIPLKGALVGLRCSEAFFDGKPVPSATPDKLRGLSLKNIKASIVDKNDKIIFSEFGEMLFTETGTSGPVILTLSSKINRRNISELRLKIDLKTALSAERLEERIIRDTAEYGNRYFKNYLSNLLPGKLIPFVTETLPFPGEKKLNSVTVAERRQFVRLLKNFTFGLISAENIETAVVTAGGIDVREIDPQTMRSKIVENLYFAGEILDVDALTGGFNIQIALSTGYAAGTAVAGRNK